MSITMSDEESFVILGSSPLGSMEPDGFNGGAGPSLHSIQRDAPPGSFFSSLKKSEINELEKALEASNKTPTPLSLSNSNGSQSMTKSSSTVAGDDSNITMKRLADSMLWSRPQIEPITTPQVQPITTPQIEPITTPQVEPITTPQVEPIPSHVEIQDDFIPLNFEDCAVPSPLTQSPKTSLTSKPTVTTPSNPSSLEQNCNKENVQPSLETWENMTILEECAAPSPLTQTPKSSLTSKPTDTRPSNPSFLEQNSNKENLQPSLETMENMTNSQNSKGSSSPKNCSLAASFILGEVNADVLKSSVYSQFPSIAMQACAEDVVKLQNMVTEYMQLKTTLEKVNNTMKLFYENSLQWKEKINHLEGHYKKQLDECQKQIGELRAENNNLKKSIEEQVEQTKAVDVARQNDRDEMIRTISEKTSLVENMRAQIVKLEEQQTATFEFLPKKPKDKAENNFDHLYITRGEHELIVKDLNRQLSEMLASNLDLKFVEKQYIDELNCLKHNLASAEESIRRNHNETVELQSLDAGRQQQIDELQRSNQELLAANAEQNERILLLEHQNQVHCKDFEMERESRQTAVGEKQQVLQDLRALQKRNQELIEEHQKFIENYEHRRSNNSMGNSFGSSTTPLVAAAAAAQSYINNPQRPIRDLPPSQLTMPSSGFDTNQYCCPVCNKSFKSISVLTSHVNDCIDKN